jgi:integrase
MNEYDVNQFAFKIDKLSEKDSVGSDYLSESEINQLIELARTKKNGEEKALFFQLAYITAVRLKALSQLTWGDVVLEDANYMISVYDKGDKLDEKYIGEDLYKQLNQLKQRHSNEDRIFKMSCRTFQDEVVHLAKELGFTNNRKITFHSIRKSSGVEVYLQTGDVELTRQHMNHSSMEVTFKNYVKIKRDYTQTGSYILAKKKKDIDKMIDEINDLDELKAILKQCSMKTKHEILGKL